MAQDNVLGIQATINGQEIKQGADGFIREVSRMERAADGLTSKLSGRARMINGEVRSMGDTFDGVVSTITRGAAAMGAAFSAQQFASQVIKVRGEFQQLEVAFNTMLGSAEKAGALMQQLTRTAAITPFGLQDVANGAKGLLAYGVASEEVNDTLVRLGDIASGLSIPLNDLVYLYGTTMTQGKMFTQDLRQFQGRGIPLADELAKQFGVTKDKVGELVTAGRVGFEDMKKAIISMTSEGGKFGGLMEAQSKTITGQISNIEDAIDMMFNEIGKSSEGVINATLGTVSKLVENWRSVADAIGYAVSAYGTYKAAIMLQDAVNNVRSGYAAAEEIQGLSRLLEIKEEVKNADLEAAVTSGRLSQAKAAELASLRAEAAQRLEVLNLKKMEAAAEEKAALEAFNIAQQEKQAADERLENMYNLYEAALEQSDASYEAYTMEQLQTASSAANTAATKLNTAEKNLNAASSKAKATAHAADTMATNVNSVANYANAASMNIMKAAALQLQSILRGLWTTLMANPLGIVAAAVGILAYGVYSFATRETAAGKATKRLNDELDEQQKKADEHKKKIDDLVSSLGNLELSEGTRIANFQTLKQEYPEILKNINTETEFLKKKHEILQQINNEQQKGIQVDNKRLLDEAEERLRRYRSQRKTSTSVVDVDGDGISTDNADEAINAELETIGKLKAKVAGPEIEKFLSNIKDMKSEDISGVLEEVIYIIQALEGSGDNAIGIVSSISDDVKEFSKTQIQSVKSALEGELSLRGGTKRTGKEWLAQYKKEYDDAQKAISDYMLKQNKLSETEFERGLKDLTDKRDAAKKKYEDAGGSVKSDNSTIKKEEEKDKELLSIKRKNLEAEIDMEKDASKKRAKQIELDYQRDMDAYNEAVKKYGKTEEVESMKTVAEKKRSHQEAELRKETLKSELQAMYDYLQEYGTIQQQKYAIAKAYDLKIEEEKDASRKRILQKEKESAIASADAANLAMGIDWGTAFKGVGNVLKEVALETLNKVEEYMKTAEFKGLSAENKQSYYELRSKLVDETGGGSTSPFNFKQWDDIAKQVTAYQNSVKKLQETQRAHTEAVTELKEKEEEFNNAVGESAKAIAKKGVEIAQGRVDETATEQQNAQGEVNDAQNNLTTSTNKAAQGISNFTSYLNEMSSGSLYGFANGVTKLVTSLGKGSDGIGKSLGEIGGKVGGIVGAILQILDALGDNPRQFIDDLLNRVSSAIEGIITDLPHIITTILEGVVDIIGGIFSGIGSWFGLSGLGDSDKNLARDIERLTASNENLQMALNNLADKLEESSVANATDVYEQQKKNLKEQMQNTQEMMIRSASASSSGFLGIGGSHSTDYKINRGMTYTDWARVSKAAGVSVRNADDFFNLTSEQMAKVAMDATDLYSKIESLADDGYKDAAKYMDTYIEYYKQLEELENEWREKLTSTSFDSVRNEFKSAMLDMEATTEDFTKSFEEMMKNAIIESLMTEKYDKFIQKWYEDFAKAMEDGELTTSEQGSLQRTWDNIVNMGIKEREALFDTMGFSSAAYSQEASSKGFEAMNQDTGEELNGRFTALQVAGEEIRRQSEQQTVLQTLISTDTAAIRQSVITQTQYVSEIADIQYESVGYLSEINKNTKQLFQMNERLGKIEENTRNI